MSCKCCGPYGRRVLVAFFEAGVTNVKLRRPTVASKVDPGGGAGPAAAGGGSPEPDDACSVGRETDKFSWAPCTCEHGEPRLSAIAASWNGWCTCDPDSTFLAALEAAVRAGHGTWSEEDYTSQIFVAVRSVAASAGLCTRERDLVCLDVPKRPLKRSKTTVVA